MRCRCVTITNPLLNVAGQAAGPVAYFQEEKVISMDNTQTTVDSGACQKAFDIASVIPILNPTTGEPTGTSVTHAELYTILYSLYMQTAKERDAEVAAALVIRLQEEAERAAVVLSRL
jgi:hypothetical protein